MTLNNTEDLRIPLKIHIRVCDTHSKLFRIYIVLLHISMLTTLYAISFM